MSFYDDIHVIESATYGKEVRPAIANCLTYSWDAVKNMMESVDALNSRVDALTDGGGGTIDPEGPTTNIDGGMASKIETPAEISTPSEYLAGTIILI